MVYKRNRMPAKKVLFTRCFPLCYNQTMKKSACFFIALALLLCTSCARLVQPAASVTAVQKEPVIIGVIDTGFSSRAIPQENVLEGKNYLNEALSTEDTYGHGTAVASVILSLVPDVQLVPLVSNAYDGGKISQVENDTFARIIRDAVDVYGCDIINISAGLSLDKSAVREAVAYAEAQGVPIVASVGNDYAEYGDLTYYPAAYETVLAVGSINTAETAISAFSQRGGWVDVYTCGEEVTIGTLSGSTRISQGTSFSAAKVTAHLARLIASAKTPQTPAQLREALMQTTKELPDGTKYIPQS